MIRERTTTFQARPFAASWTGALLPLFAVLLQLSMSYALAWHVCNHGGSALLHVVCALCFLLTLLGVTLALREWRASGRRWPSDEDEGESASLRFLAACALLSSSYAALISLALWSAVFVLEPCSR